MQEEKKEYKAKIKKLLDRCDNIALLDFIYQLLWKHETRAAQIAK